MIRFLFRGLGFVDINERQILRDRSSHAVVHCFQRLALTPVIQPDDVQQVQVAQDVEATGKGQDANH